MKQTNFPFILVILVITPLLLAFSGVDSLEKQFANQIGLKKVETGLQILDSMADDPEQQITFAKSLLLLANNELPNSIQQAKIYRKLSDSYLLLDSLEQSNQQLLRAIEISLKLPKFDTVFIADAYSELGVNYNELGDNITAKKYLIISIDLFEKAGKSDDVANVKSDLAIVFHAQGNYSEAIALLNEVYQMDLTSGDKRSQSSSLNNIGRMYVDWKKYETGLEYYKRSVQLLDTIADFEVLGIRYNNIGMVYQLMEKHREAITWFEKAQKIDEKEKNSIRLGIRYFNIGNSYLALKNYQKARINLEESLAIFINSNMHSRISKVYGSLGSLYMQEGDFVKAEEHLLHSLEMAEKGGNIPEISICYSKLYQFYKQTGNLKKALDYHEFYTVAKDSIYNLQASKQIEELEAQYQNEKKEAEISRLEKENDLKIKELTFRKRERNWAIAGAFLFFVAAGSFFYLFSTVKKQKAKLSEQNLELDRLNKTLNRLFAIISHDLRNATAAYQSSAKVIQHHLERGQPEKLLPIAAEINANAGNLSTMLENLLQWSVIQMKGLSPRREILPIAEEVEKITSLYKTDAEKKGNNITIDVAPDHEIYCDRESFSLILRNLIGNANKFTSNGEITIASKKEGQSMILIVRDTGCGMTEKMKNEIFSNHKENVRNGTSGEKGTGLGLIMVKEHVEKNGGSIVVESNSEADQGGNGTTFVLHLPSEHI
jgi:signal transduction histidine kinase/Tfp pilus assembly protein PilF